MFKELGYYSCDGKIFETKLQAMLYANPQRLNIKWHFNEEKFNSYDWSVEPSLSLDQLYNMRARQIREQYDYVILSYSGGADSNNILESFLRQGLHVDEIITAWALDANTNFIVNDSSEKSTWNTAAEYQLHTSHRLNYIKNRSPNTKITVLDSSKTIVDTLLNNDDANWVSSKNDVFNVTGAFQYNLLYFSNLRKRFDGLGRVAYVIGIDKPLLLIRENSLYLYFLDKVASIIPIKENIKEYDNIRPVMFYWSPDSCDILAKQAHSVLKYIKTNEKAKAIWSSTDAKMIRHVQEILLKDIIYTTWNHDWFQVQKTTQDWNSELDYWFTKGWSGTKEHSIWLDGLKNLVPKISSFVAYEKDGRIRGTRPYVSNFYKIGNIDNLQII